MVFFRKNKRQFGFRHHRKVFVAMFLFGALSVSGIISLISRANAAEVPVPSVEFYSENTDYQNGEEGAWKITKSASWTGQSSARITFDVKTIAKQAERNKLDLVLVLDNSGSMEGAKMARLQTDASNLINVVLEDTSNQIAIVSFDSVARIHTSFTNDKNLLLDQVQNHLFPFGETNYYDGLLKAEDVLQDYEQQDGRDLVLLFLTDGLPNVDTPNQVAQYRKLKAVFPYMTVNGIQYEMGDEMSDYIVEISDNQFLADKSTLSNILLEAANVTQNYEDFIVIDYINATYWEVLDQNDISTTLGQARLIEENSRQRVVWDMSDVFYSGQAAQMTIDIELSNGYKGPTNLLLPTNINTKIDSAISGLPNETIDSSNTPILKSAYDVIYEANAPSGCDVSGAIPETESHTIFTTVEFQHTELSCDGYEFKGWSIVTPDVKRINDDHFRMPGTDVIIRGVWGKPSIAKTLDGTVHQRNTAKLNRGEIVNDTLRLLADPTYGDDFYNYYKDDTTITAILRADAPSPLIDYNNELNILSAEDSELPVYVWFENGIIYYYTDATIIYLDSICYEMFRNLAALVDISGISDWRTDNVTNMYAMFQNNRSLTNLDALSGWDVSNVTVFDYIFSFTESLVDIDGISNWNMSNNSGLSGMFWGSGITNVDALSGWNVSNATAMNDMFNKTYNLTDISGLSGWMTSSLTNIDNMFSYSGITNVDALSGWDTSSLYRMSQTFMGAEHLTDISGLAGWDTSGLTSTYYTFSGSGITDISALSGWKTSGIIDARSMFENTNISNISALSGWNMGAAQLTAGMFSNTNISDLSALSGWGMGSAYDLREMFRGTNITNVNALSSWNTQSILLLDSMFADSVNLSDISGLSGWNTQQVGQMNGLFSNTSITNVNALSGWDTKNVSRMDSMFADNTNLTDISGLSRWDTKKLANASFMFQNTGVTNLNALSGWDTKKLTNASYMFYNATDLTDITGISRWDTKKLTNTSYMFTNDAQITNLTCLDDWRAPSTRTGMFDGIPASVTRPSWY